MPIRIVITGGPGSGKTKFVERLKLLPEIEHFLFFEELARLLLMENPGYRRNLSEFHREIYSRQIAREQAAEGKSFVTDRGTVDAFAFHPETANDVGTTIEREYARYDAVIQLGSAAALGEPHYARDAERHETISEALFIEKAIIGVWQKHPGYQFVEAVNDFEIKYRNFLNIIRTLIVSNNN